MTDFSDAPRPGVIPLRSLTIGEIFAGAFTTVRRYPAPLLGGTALVLVVSNALGLFLATPLLDDLQRLADLQRALTVGPEPSWDDILPVLGRIGIGSSATALVSLLGQVLVSGLVTVVVGRAVVGAPVTVGEAWAELRPRILPLLGVSILVAAAVAVGAALCGLPGLWIAVVFSLTTPAVVLERLTVRRSFGRSKALVRGAWWSTFGVLAAAVGIGWLVNLGLSTAFGTVSYLAAFSGQPVTYSAAQLVGSVLVGTASGVLTSPFVSAVVALVYLDRRIVAERFDVQLARSFGRP